MFQNKLGRRITLNISLKSTIQIENALNQLTTVNLLKLTIVCFFSYVILDSLKSKNWNKLPSYLINLLKEKRKARATRQNSKYLKYKSIYNKLTMT